MPPRVLVVDDDKVSRLLCRRAILGAYPAAELEECDSGEAALARLQGARFDVVLSDQTMPRMTGVDLLARAQVEHPDARRILITGNADLDLAVQALDRAGIDGFVEKAIDPAEFERDLRKVLAQHLRP